MKILIVEDSAEKRRRISSALLAVEGIDEEAMEFGGDVRSAFQWLKAETFDLMILDINLPLRPDSDADKKGGIILLNQALSQPETVHLPNHIVGLTEFEEAFDEASSSFGGQMITLAQYSSASTEWEFALQARVRHILITKSQASLEDTNYKSDLAVICALEKPELQAIRALNWNWEQIALPHDHTIYWRGTYQTAKGSRTVHAAAAVRMGMPAATVLAMKMIQAFRPRYLAMTGIAAGVRGKVQIGNIVAADPCWDSGSGKSINLKNNAKFLPSPHQIPLDVDVREQLKSISSDSVFLAQIKESWPAEKPTDSLELKVGPLASGATVLADRTSIQRVAEDQHRQLIGFEMEAYGVFLAAEEAPKPHPTPFVIKSIVDFANGEKNDTFQAYGAYTSAQVLKRLAEKHL